VYRENVPLINSHGKNNVNVQFFFSQWIAFDRIYCIFGGFGHCVEGPSGFIKKKTLK
jgi:hypothetical protein